MRTFQHGGDVESFAKELGCSVDEIIDLSSNINHIKPKIEIDFNSIDSSAYPKYDKLYRDISNHYHIDSKNLQIYNGASSAIFALFALKNLTKEKKCYIYTPAYLEYKRASLLFGYEYIPIDRFSDMKKDISNDSLVVFVNPSTPDGRYYNLDELMDRWIEKGATIIIDESFLEFCDKKSYIEYIERYDRVYIIKSMTKFYASAGIRIGNIISSTQNISKLKKYTPSWQLSIFDTIYIQEALKDKSLKDRTLDELQRDKKALIEIFQNYPYSKKIYQSDSNYLLIKLSIRAKEFQDILKQDKILIRDCSNFDGLDEYHIRVAIKDIASINKLKKVLL